MSKRLTFWVLGFCVALSSLLAACRTLTGSSPSPSPSVRSLTDQPSSVIIDTDMAADDWMAILYLLQRPDVSIQAISVTGAGEAHCGPGIEYALGLVALAGSDDVPVACGRETPLEGDHTFPSSWRNAVDNLYGLTLPHGTNPAPDQTAVELLTSLIQSSPQKITLLTLGPLTNVAEALQRSPALVDNLEMIYIMGGAVDVPGNVGGSNRVAEWNIYVDPHAANIVLESGAPITLVSLDATNHVPLTTAFYEQLEDDHSSSAATFVFDLLTKNRGFISSGGYYFWDPLAAAILADDSLADFEMRWLAVVEEEGSESGYTKPVEDGASVRVAISADGSRFEQIFLDTLNGR